MAKELRFAVGNSENLRSSVWRLWANKDDLFLAARSLAGLSKISFHKSGICRYALNSKIPRAALLSWPRPSTRIPDVTSLFGIIVPEIKLESRFVETPPPSSKATIFLKAPKGGEKITVIIVLTPAHFTEAQVKKLPADTQITVHGRVEMLRETAWLISSYAVLSIDELRQIKKMLRTTIHLNPGLGDNKDITGFLAQLHSLEGGKLPPHLPTLTDIQLGRENIAWVNDKGTDLG